MGLPGAERTTKRSEEAEPGGIKSSADEQTARAERIEKRSENAEPEGINLIRGRRDGTSWHNAAKFPHSVPGVNEAVGWRRFSFLPGEWERSGHSLPN